MMAGFNASTGQVEIDGKRADRVSFLVWRLPDNRFDICFSYNGNLIVRLEKISPSQCLAALGDENMNAINKSTESFGVMEGERLRYYCGKTPAQSKRCNWC